MLDDLRKLINTLKCPIESNNKYFQYTLFLLILVIGQIIIAAFVFVYNDDVIKATDKGFDRLWQSRSVPVSIQAIDGIQRTLQCCGKSSFLDYGASVPASCCDKDSQFCNALTRFVFNYKLRVTIKIDIYFYLLAINKDAVPGLENL